MKQMKRTIKSPIFFLVLAALCATACTGSDTALHQAATVDALLSDGELFDGVDVMLDGCIEPNAHGLNVFSCQPEGQAIAVLYGQNLQAAQSSYLREQAMRSRVERKQPLAVTLCGSYHEANDGKDRWLEVTAFSIGGADYGNGLACRNLEKPTGSR